MLAMKRYYPDGTPRSHHLALEGVLAAVAGTLFGLWLFPDEVSLVAVFLASITTTDSIERTLDWNRRAIIEEGQAPLRANLLLTLRILAMFLGTVVGFSFLVFMFPLEAATRIFDYQLQDIGDAHLETLRFGGTVPILVHNLYVLIFFFVIAMPFRQGGVMLAVAWNASVWGATFGVLARRWTDLGGPAIIDAYTLVIASVLPHMALEAFAYVIAGFAGVFLSKGLLKYEVDSPILLSIARTVAIMLLGAFVLVCLGAVWESNLTPLLVRFVTGG